MQKLRKTIALFLALAMALSIGALAADNEQGEQGPRLWTRWLQWDDEGHPCIDPDQKDIWFDGGQWVHPGEVRYVAFYTADSWDENDQPINPQIVKLADLKADAGVILNPYNNYVAEGDELADCYVELMVEEFNKEYTISCGDAAITVFSYLPDIAIYDAPERTTEHYMPDNVIPYTPGHMEDVYYILSDSEFKENDHTVESLVLSENDRDTINDLAVLTEVGGGVYTIRLKDGAKPYEHDEQRIRITITWKDKDGNTWEDDSYEIWCENRYIISASEEPVLDGTKSFPDWDYTKYSNAADKLSSTVTMTAGEEKTVYLLLSYLNYSQTS